MSDVARMDPAAHPDHFPDHTRTEPAMKVREVTRAPAGGLEGAIARAILQARRERQAREREMYARFGCCLFLLQAEREAGG